jgi:hypothetical protein
MVHLSPTPESYNESLSAMKFASMVNKCELGKPKKQVTETAAAEDKAKASPTNATKTALRSTMRKVKL